jgi:hypothetical protein
MGGFLVRADFWMGAHHYRQFAVGTGPDRAFALENNLSLHEPS